MASITDVASSSSRSKQTPRWINHVFLSFRGDDTRKGFADHLFASLERRGIKTFRDDYDLDRGEEISQELMKAIEGSMFAIIILSQNYASSTWCLIELQTITECKRTLGQTVFPVFYGVNSSDVRHQKGTFAEAFKKHEERFGEEKEKVGRWRDALRDVASYSGWDCKDEHEAALVEEIVDHVQKILIPKLPSWADNLVGVESRMKELNSVIGMRLDDVRFIGIWGMGGIGKTTIARLEYEAIKGQFEFSCFLANIREMSATNGLVHIQREVLSHLNVRSGSFYNLFDGKKIIANSLCNKKVLLVLDDVSELSQLENLAEKHEWFGPGSRVIITTRDKHLLETHGVHKTCEFGGLFQSEAYRLFCLRAFKRGQPEKGYQNLCKEVVEYTRGLPLALEVLGSHLYGRTIEVWRSALKQIGCIPHPEIQNALRISYDGLHSTEKDIFLDIACFFKGMGKDEVIDILENCGHFAKIGIEILIERSLVTLDGKNNKLEMHDLLQEMGRNIVFQESPNNPSRRSRLWSQDHITHVLTKNKGTEAIQGVVLNLAEPYEARWSTEAFSKTCQLRLLKLCEMRLPLGLSCLPCALKVLHWKGCPLKTLPLTSQSDELVDIKLCHSKIEQLWHGTMILEKLKSINLSFSKNLKQCPDLVGVPNLKSLVLEGCTSLTEIHPSVVCHKKLVLLNLMDCKRLKALPRKIEMSSLENLNLSGCSELKTVPEFGESMRHLSELSLEGTAITELPSSLGCLADLAVLDLKNCKNLVSLPDTIHKLKSLMILNVSGCKGPVSKLNMFLPFKWCFWSQQAPIGFGLPPSISCLSVLRSIDLSYCNLFEESIPDDFCSLSSLKKLDLAGNNFVSLPSSISKLSKLEYLCLNWCKKLQWLPEVPLSIRGLDASNCASLVTSTFNPSNPCSIFASPIQWHLPREPRSLLEGLGFPTAKFDMLITGSEIPSWFNPPIWIDTARIQLSYTPSRFAPRKLFDSADIPILYTPSRFARQRCSQSAKIPVPCTLPLTDCVGFALCFLVVSYADAPEVCHHKIECYLQQTGESKSVPISSRNLPPLEPECPHLYILFLSIVEFISCRDRIYEHGYCSEIEFALEIFCCHSLRIKRSGWRLVRKANVADIYGNHF